MKGKTENMDYQKIIGCIEGLMLEYQWNYGVSSYHISDVSFSPSTVVSHIEIDGIRWKFTFLNRMGSLWLLARERALD